MNAEYTIVLPHDDACALIRGEVPHDVMVACISAVRSLARTPEDVIRDMRERQRPLLDVPRRRRAGR